MTAEFRDFATLDSFGDRRECGRVDGLKLSVPETRKELMLAELHTFPDLVTAQQGYRRLQSTVARQGFTLDGKSKAGQKAVQEAWKEAGFRAEQTVDGWIWVRNQELAKTVSSSNTTITS